MSRLMLSPNYCSCTVNRARNLPDKGKNGGPDAFCVIAMGKEKFATAVQERNTAPDWHEQCDMPVVDDATIKLTVYHNSKSTLSKGDFIGRAHVPIRDLQDYDRIHTNWYPLTNKDGRVDKDRGEIEVSLKFFSKNNTTGSVLDLATKKKHLSLKDIKHSLGDKLKTASKHRRPEKYAGENQLADQQRRLGGDEASAHNGRDFLEDSISDTTSFSGSHMSLNSMSFNNNNVEQPKKQKSRAPTNTGLGATLGSITPYSSRRSVTSDYETSSILDSASMYGGDDTSAQLPLDRTQTPQVQQQREVSVDEISSVKDTPKQKKRKEPAPSKPVPTIITPKSSPNSPVLPEHSQNLSVSGDDIEAAFDCINDYKASLSKAKEPDTADSFFGLSTINEQLDSEDNPFSSKQRTDDEIDFDHYFDKFKQQSSVDETKPKRTAPVPPQAKAAPPSTLALSDDIYTPATSVSIKADTSLSSTSTLPAKHQSSEEKHESTDDDIDEIIGKLERVSSMRSSVRRKIQPTHDITQPSFFELDGKPPSGFTHTPSTPKKHTMLPDIVVEQPAKSSAPLPPSRKTGTTGLNVLGYENVKATPVNPKIRQELDYLDREELLHLIAYQSDLIKKRDARVKDLEHYTDGLLVKIVEQCPAILQSGSMKFNHK